MRALILAAGRGERLKQPEPKPLTPFLGITLIERIILSMKQKGIEEAIIITGYRSSEIIEKLKHKKIDIKLTFIENPEWEKGNGVSALKAKSVLERDAFLLLMCDHIFDTDLLEFVCSKYNKNALCIDRNLTNVFDIDDATKIQIKDGVPMEIGKTLENYNAVDCGIFYCTQEIFTALEKTVSEKKYQLTDAIRYLIESSRLDIIDITGRFWIDIDTQKSLNYAKQRVLDSLSKPTDGIISRLFNRQISKHITHQLVQTDITPNMVSIIAFVLIAISSILFSLGEQIYLLIGGILVQFSSIIDGCDGEIARLKFIESRYGAFFDSILDRYADSFIIFGLAYGYWTHHGNFLIWPLGLFALIGVFSFSYTNARYEAIFGNYGSRGIPFRRDMRLFLVAIGAITNQIIILFLVLASLTNIEVIRRIITLRKSLL